MRTQGGFAEPQACAGSSFPLTDGCSSQAWGSQGTNKSLFALEELVGKKKKRGDKPVSNGNGGRSRGKRWEMWSR